MTALREAVRRAMIAYGQAVLAAYKADPRDNGPEDMDRIFGAIEPAREEAIAAVLRAADAGESEGPWRVNKPMDPHSRHWFKTHWFVDSAEEVTGGGFYFSTEPEARAVCNALNRIALTGAGRGGI